MLRASILLFIIALGLAAGLAIHFADDRPAMYTYTGSEFCAGCHASSAAGEIYQSWSQGPHARAYNSLQTPQAQEYIRRNGVDVNTCLPCHATLGRTAFNDYEQRINAEGIGCERCHGPGSNYSQTIIMKDPEAFTRNGGSPGSLVNCYSCHMPQPDSVDQTEHPDGACPFQTEPFNADSLWPAVAHSIRTSRSQTEATATDSASVTDSATAPEEEIQ